MIPLVKSFFIAFRDFVYPNACFLCKKQLPENELRICSACWNEIPQLEYDSPELTLKRNQLRMSGFIDDFTAAYLFEQHNRLQEIIHQLKYGEKRTFGVALGRRLGEKVKQQQQFAAADMLIPIPLHKLKKRERGYNQCDYIAEGLTSILNIPIRADMLTRTAYTKTQTNLNYDERHENMRGVFAIPEKFKKEINGKTILLLDDVITSGATVSSAGEELKLLGAKNVFAVSAGLTALEEE